MDILKFIDSLEDPRRKQGQRHKFRDILTIIIMAILSGHQGLRGFNRFAKANADELTKTMKLRRGIPSYSTFQAMLKDLDDQLLSKKFIEWVRASTPDTADELIALDGKAIRSTITGGNTLMQNFVAVVSAFGHSSGIVYGMNSYENGKTGECIALQKLIAELGLKGKTFTTDALHTQKKP